MSMKVVTLTITVDNLGILTVLRYLPVTKGGKIFLSSIKSMDLTMRTEVPKCKKLKSLDKDDLMIYLKDCVATMINYDSSMENINLDRTLNTSVKCTFTIGKL